MSTDPEVWPALPYDEWKDTYATFHRWTQIVGKICTACCPWLNHSWHVTLHVTPRGLITSSIPHGTRTFQIDFNLVDHRLGIVTSDGASGGFHLRPMTVAAFYTELMLELRELGVPVTIHGKPNELPDTLPFAEDDTHSAYDPEYADRLRRVLVQSDRVLTGFRSRFLGKSSPVHVFWGALDLAVTRFSGRPAPEHAGGFPHLPDWITREAYSHEVSSAGLWLGGEKAPAPMFYSYAYPSPAGFAETKVRPGEAFWSGDMGEFFLPYDVVRTADDPDAVLLEFLQSTYEAAAETGKWDRMALERPMNPADGD